jgi:FKBP-type peptidyl-prolyl cis-trans isomerase
VISYYCFSRYDKIHNLTEINQGALMKQRYFALVIMSLIATPVMATDATSPLSQEDKLSYSLGHNIGTTLKQQEIAVELKTFAKGIEDGLTNSSQPLLTQEEMADVLKVFQRERISKKMASFKEESDKNLKAGEEFLAANGKKEGVVTLPSGLQYKVITEGTGKTPKATDSVTTHYRGTLIDGTEFDSSYKRGEPASFEVGGVIAGWTEALQLMKEGAKWQLFVPAKLAYGQRGAGEKIGPNATLIFEVELLSVKEKESKVESGDTPPTTPPSTDSPPK